MKENKENKESFFTKMKDKKYASKVELIVGFSLILIMFLYLRITGTTNYEFKEVENVETQNVEITNIDLIPNNYSYNININIEEENDTVVYNYNGLVYNDKKIINKKANEEVKTIYEKNNKFYIKNDDKYEETEDITDMFNIIEYKLLSLSEIKKMVKIAKLDHTTNYSTGEVTYTYNLPLNSLIETYKGTDVVTIDVSIKDNIPKIEIDYTKYFKEKNDKIKNVKIEFTYEKINQTEEFDIEVEEGE